MKKKILVLALVAIMLSLAAYGTLAAFSAQSTSVNTITMGSIDAKIIERYAVNETTEPWPTDGHWPNKVMPGASVSKIVTVQNTGSADAWIRARVEVKMGNEPVGSDKISLDFTNNWTQSGDWYYCNSSVAANAETAALFNNVTFVGDEMGNEFKGADISITVYAEAVQVANNGTSATAASGWPTV